MSEDNNLSVLCFIEAKHILEVDKLARHIEQVREFLKFSELL